MRQYTLTASGSLAVCFLLLAAFLAPGANYKSEIGTLLDKPAMVSTVGGVPCTCRYFTKPCTDSFICMNITVEADCKGDAVACDNRFANYERCNADAFPYDRAPDYITVLDAGCGEYCDGVVCQWINGGCHATCPRTIGFSCPTYPPTGGQLCSGQG